MKIYRKDGIRGGRMNVVAEPERSMRDEVSAKCEQAIINSDKSICTYEKDMNGGNKETRNRKGEKKAVCTTLFKIIIHVRIVHKVQIKKIHSPSARAPENM